MMGNFIFEVKLPEYLYEALESIFIETKSLAEFNSEKMNHLFREPGKATLHISRDKKKALKYERKSKGSVWFS